MSAQPLPEPVRDLLAAISETLTLPDPGSERMDLVRYESCVSERLHLIKLIIRDVLDGKDKNGLEWETAYLRQQNEARPPRYRTLDEYLTEPRRVVAEAGEGQ
jgi:hypothetical protein